MRTAEECLEKAAEMERIADACPIAEVAAAYKGLAVSWGQLSARQAAWQDEFLSPSDCSKLTSKIIRFRCIRLLTIPTAIPVVPITIRPTAMTIMARVTTVPGRS